MNRNMFHRPFGFLLSACLLISALTACGGGSSNSGTENPGNTSGNTSSSTKPETSTNSSVPARNDLIVGLQAEPPSLSPLVVSERIAFLPIHAIHDTLVFEDDSQNIVAGLAESWDVSEDGTEYTFKIREGVKFHDGATMTAEDVAYSIDYLRNNHKANYGLINNVEAIDDTHVKMTLDYAFSPILFLLSQTPAGIVHKEVFETDPTAYARNPAAGTGPFKFVEWVSGDSIVLERFDDYWQGPAPMEKITFRLIADESTNLIALEAGELDTYIQVSQGNKSIVDNNPNLAWYETPGSQVYTLAFNNGVKPNGEKSIFADNQALREAICYAINKEDIVIAATENAAPPLYTPYPSFVAHYPENFDGNVYNIEKAKEKLAEAGYPNGLTIKMRVTSQANYSRPAEIIMGQLSQIGITVELDQMERGTYTQEVYNNFDYDMTVWAVSCDYPDADHGAYRRFYSGMISPTNNYMQINDPDLDEAIMTNRTSQDDAARAAAVLKIAEIVRDKSYCLPLYAMPQTLAANASLKGVNVNYAMVVDFYQFSW